VIANVEQLEELLSRPSQADTDALTALDGDLLILGVGGKMGPTLARRAKRACPAKRVIGVSRFQASDATRRGLEAAEVETITADLLDSEALARLPDAENVIFMAARKFGSTGSEWLTWAMNAFLPGKVAERFPLARIVAFSTGNVYPLSRTPSTESSPTAPVGEYAQSALARERMFEYGSAAFGTRVTLLRLNYAAELRYGVLLDIGLKVFERRAVDLSMGHVNVIWQGDANSVCLRSFALCTSPPTVLNVTGPETISVRWIAERFGERFGIEPAFEGAESDTALLSNAARCHNLFGYPAVTLHQMIEWTADWIGMGGTTLNKPTMFEKRDGRF
jgi:nucleoside-diphosphate-sugar epimerase